MALYDLDKLMDQTRKLAADYYQATKQTLPVSAELARYDACRLLALRDSSDEQPGVDAKDQNDTPILIKSRVILDESKGGHRIGQLSVDGGWAEVVLVLFDKDYQPFEIYRTSRTDIEESMSQTTNPKRLRRGAMSVARFKAIGELVWAAGG